MAGRTERADSTTASSERMAPARANEDEFPLARKAAIPLCWARATRGQDHINLGDALSPVIVAALSGRAVRHAEFDAKTLRMSAVGTIGHGLQNGAVWVWGTGASDQQVLQPGTGAALHVRATRGPLSWKRLSGEEPGPDAAFGDPVWLLPRFYNPPRAPKWELGVIMHLSEHTARNVDLTSPPIHRRYAIPESLGGSVRMLDTITAVSPAAMRQRVDDILACKRIVSTSLHGMVIAEAYGIPCLYFPPRMKRRGPRRVELRTETKINQRFADLYLGLGLSELPVYAQPRNRETRWDRVMRSIDINWAPKSFDADRLIEAFPLPISPFQPEKSGDLFASPLVRGLSFQAS